mmetsp:Transcript_31945/g.77690  ORF Transcript_31945/g.77690 Transcript_31945/m.77690 type:complete len:1003 (-) Transcript_31945:976-3984(-)
MSTMKYRRNVFRVGLFDRIHKKNRYVLHHDEKEIDLSTTSSSDGGDNYDDGRIHDNIDVIAADETFVGSEPDTNSPDKTKQSLVASSSDNDPHDDEDLVVALSLLANHRYDLSPMDMGMLDVRQLNDTATTSCDEQAVLDSKRNNQGRAYDDSDAVHFSSLNDVLPAEPIQPDLAPCNSFTSNQSFASVNVMSRSSSFSSIGFIQDSPARGRMMRQSQHSTSTRGLQQQQQQQPRCSSLPPLPPKKEGDKPPLLTHNQISNILSTKEPTNQGLRLFLKLTQKLSTTDIEEDGKEQENNAQDVSSSGGVANDQPSVETREPSTESDGQDQQGSSTDEVMSSLAPLEELHRSSSTSSSKNSDDEAKLGVSSIPNNEESSNWGGSKQAARKAEIDEARTALIEAGRSALLGTANSTKSFKTEESITVGSDEDTFVPGPKTCEPVTNKEMAVPQESPFQKISNQLEQVDTKKVSFVKSSAMRSNTNRDCRPGNTTATATKTVISVSTIDATIAATGSHQVDSEEGLSGPKTAMRGYSSHVDAFVELNKSDAVKEEQPRSFFPRDIIEFSISPEENVVISCEGPPSTDELCSYKIHEGKSFHCDNATKQYFDQCLGRQVETEVAETSTDQGNVVETEPSAPIDDDTTSSNHGSSMVGCSNVVGWNLCACTEQSKDDIAVPSEDAIRGHNATLTDEDTASSKYTFPSVECSKLLDSIPGAAALFRTSSTSNVDTEVVSLEQAKTTEKVYSDRIEIPSPEEPTDRERESIFAESRRAFRRACCMVDELLVTDARNVNEMEQNVVEEETNIPLGTIPEASQTTSQPPAGGKNLDSQSCDKMFCFSSMKEMWNNYACGQTTEVDECEPEPQPELEFEPEPVADARVSEDVQDQEVNCDDDDFNNFCEFDEESVFGISVFSALDISVISAGTGNSGEYKTNTSLRIRSCDRSQRSWSSRKSAVSTSVVHKSFERPPSSCSKNIADDVSPIDNSCDQSASPTTNKATESFASC